jgi:hypothetical protein
MSNNSIPTVEIWMAASYRRYVEEWGVRFSIRSDMVAVVSQGNHKERGKGKEWTLPTIYQEKTLALKGFGTTTLEGEGSVTAIRYRAEVSL